MTKKYKTAHLDRDDVKNDAQAVLMDIVDDVKARLSDALCDPSTELNKVHPRTLIAMIGTNIIVNLLRPAIGDNDIKTRLNMVQDCLDEVNNMSMYLWKALEANSADLTNAH